MSNPLNSRNDQDNSPEKIKREKQSANLSTLIFDAIDQEFGLYIHPEKLIDYKKNRGAYVDKIFAHMQDLRDKDPETWWKIQDDVMREALSTKMVDERLLWKEKGRLLTQRRAHNRIIGLFPDITHDASFIQKVTDRLSLLPENELSEIAARWAKARNFLKQTLHKDDFLYLQDGYVWLKKDFEKLFDIAWISNEDKRKFLRAYGEYKKFGMPIGESMIKELLDAYHSKSDEQRVWILSEFWVMLSLKQIYALWLKDERWFREFARENFNELFDKLSSEQQLEFIKQLLQDDTKMYPIKEFENNKKSLDKIDVQNLAEEISNTLYLDLLPDNTKHPEGILEQIRKEKLEEAEKSWSVESYNIHESVIRKMMERFRGDKIKNLQLLEHEGSVIQLRDSRPGIQFLRLEAITDGTGLPFEDGEGSWGVRFHRLPVIDGRLHSKWDIDISYDALVKLLENNREIEILSADVFSSLLTDTAEEAGQDGKIYDISKIDDQEEVNDESTLIKKLDLLDPQGQRYGFSEGTCFIAPSEEAKSGKSKNDDIWMVKKVHNGKVYLIDSDGFEWEKGGYPINDFYRAIKDTPEFERIGKIGITSTEDIKKELQEVVKLDSNAVIKDGKILVEGDDWHGHHGKEKEITCFVGKSWGHIRLFSIGDGVVEFGEYDPGDNELSNVREYAKKHGLDEKIKNLYSSKRMSYPAFIRYLQSWHFESTKKDELLPDAGHHHEHAPHAHLHSSFLKRMMKWQNPASIWKGFEMIWHSLEHTLEKGAKLDAARFAMSTSHFLNLPGALEAQIYSDIVNESKEIVEKYEKKIFGLPGPAGRWKALHIVQDRDSRPEEVMSAINYMLKSYGHLYGEDVKHYQSVVTPFNIANAQPGYFAFFDGLVLTSKLPGDLYTWRDKAYRKAISEMGTEKNHEGNPTEEQLLHALFKTVDGNWQEYPYAASVVKAVGGPSGFEKNWKFEGFENAYKKGKEQTQMVNAQWRLNKAVGYFNTHEIYKAVGAMEAVAAKTKAPLHQAMPFIWAVWGYSRHASHTALQKLKWYGENGLSFHAFSFLRNEEENTTYRDTVRLALQDLVHQGKIESKALSDFDSISSRLINGPENTEVTDKKYGKVSPPMAMMQFWQKYHDKGLHDMLQAKNGWLTMKQKEGNETARKYLNTILGHHSMQLKDSNIPWGTDYGPDWYNEHGYQNLILSAEENGLRGLKSMLNKINFIGPTPGAKSMDENNREKIWNYLKQYMAWPKNSPGTLRNIDFFINNNSHESEKKKREDAEKLQKEQFLFHRREILHYFAEKLTARTMKVRDPNMDMTETINSCIRTYSYYKDLADMGIDPRAVFDEKIETENTESDYKRWKEGRTAEVVTSSKKVPDIESIVQGKSRDVINTTNASFQTPKAWPRMKPLWWKGWEPWQDPDLAYPGWAEADTTGIPDDSSESGHGNMTH